MINKNKIIFLDIDGVLSTGWGAKQPKELWFDNFGYPFDKKCVETLNSILSATDAQLVLSSDWRFMYSDLPVLKKLFDFNQVIQSPIAILDIGFKREEGIEKFVTDHAIDNFVILDDLNLTVFPERLVKIEPIQGLTSHYRNQIVEIFNMTHINEAKMVKLSKYLSLILRHNPQKIGISLEKDGWADVQELLTNMQKHGSEINIEILHQIVNSDKKQRYAFNELKTKIKANYGHSTQIELNYETLIPPEFLFHGTSYEKLESIKKYGILKQKRRFVHLSPDMENAAIVGKRHGTPIVLKIYALEMHLKGIKFYKSSGNIWLTDLVETCYFEPVNFTE